MLQSGSTPSRNTGAIVDPFIDDKYICNTAKYCNRLPCDTFTQLSVLKKTVQLPNGKFITSLVLPNNSHLRGLIQGSPQDTEELRIVVQKMS